MLWGRCICFSLQWPMPAAEDYIIYIVIGGVSRTLWISRINSFKTTGADKHYEILPLNIIRITKFGEDIISSINDSRSWILWILLCHRFYFSIIILYRRLAGNVKPPDQVSFIMVQSVEYLEAKDSDAIPLLRILNLGTSIPTSELRTVQEYISDCNRGIVDVHRLCLL